MGIFTPGMTSSGMSSKCFTSARRLFPWALTRTLFPDRTAGTMRSCQQGRKRSTVDLDVKMCRLYRSYKELTMKGVKTWEDVENRSWIFHRFPLWKHLLGMLRIVLDSRNTPDQNDPGLQSLVRAVEKELDKFKFEERLIHLQECRFLMS